MLARIETRPAGLDDFFKELSADIIKRKLTPPNPLTHSQEISQAVSQHSPVLSQYHSVVAHKAEPYGALNVVNLRNIKKFIKNLQKNT